MNKGNIDHYMQKSFDVDFSTYLVINADVICFRKGINPSIDEVLSRFDDRVDKSTVEMLYIKGNRLFFTLNGVKYWTIPTVFATEWLLIDDLIADLSQLADDIAYKEGELD